MKFCTYFPYNAKLCLNGHEYAKRQLAQQAIAYQALDNGVLSCADPDKLQQLCDGLHNLPKPREIGFHANRRLLEVERLSYDCIPSQRTPFNASTARSRTPLSAPPDCALPIPAPTPYVV